MRNPTTMRRAAVFLAAVICVQFAPARADEVVTFPSARYLVGTLTQRLAREHGEPLQRAPAEMIKGYLSRPNGDGPFPAIVHLHGCGGLLDKRRVADARQFTNWGYVTLMVDSFATRGIKDACAGLYIPARQADAMGALVYMSKLSFVDPARIAVVGYSQGGSAALNIASVPPAELFEMPAG
ncbi:MAG: alpha/beta hydrolase family protein, partial [Steroidobacteraceae bacterium]